MNSIEIIKFLDMIENENFDMEKKDRSFDDKKMNDFLSSIKNLEHKKTIKKMIMNTIYVNYNSFKSKLIECFELFSNKIKNKPFMILFMINKFGSSHWIQQILWSKIKSLNFKGFLIMNKYNICNLKEVNGVKNILIIEDFSRIGMNIPCTITADFKWHIVIPYLTKDLEKNLLDINDHISVEKINYRVYNVVKVDENISIYFDHKDSLVSMYLFNEIMFTYLDEKKIISLLKEPPSRVMIEKLKSMYDKELRNIMKKEELEIINNESKFVYHEKKYEYIRCNFYKIYRSLKDSSRDIYKISEIIPDKLYLGPYNINIFTLINMEIDIVICCARGLDKPRYKIFEFKYYPLMDFRTQDIGDTLKDSTNFIEESGNKKIYVYCLAGVSRSASVVIGYVAKKYDYSFIKAYNYVHKKRDSIKPNESFCFQLLEYIGK